jgi:hypothetical protein
MRRLITIAAFLFALSLIPAAVLGQRGGGGGHGGGFGGGGHGGFSSAHSGFSGHSGFSSSPSFGGSRFSSSSGSHFSSGSRNYGHYGYRGPYYGSGYRYRWPYAYSYYGYPYYGYDPWWNAWWWDNGPSSYDEDSMNQRQLASEMNQQNLEEQDWLRQQNSQDQDAYSRPPRPAQPAAESQPENDPATVLVFRDQHQREIHNYAIADGILYNFTSTRTEKIPLAVIDVPATVKANDDRGVEFHLPPPPNEGQ